MQLRLEANLVAFAGLESHFNQRRILEPLEDPVDR